MAMAIVDSCTSSDTVCELSIDECHSLFLEGLGTRKITMSGGDGLPLLIFAIPVGWAFAAIGWDAVLNMPAKKKLLDQYATEGVDVIAFVLQQNVTTFRTIATRKKHQIRYAYKEAGSDQVYVRDYVKWHAACGTQIEFVAPIFTVNILSGYPRSGIPKFRVYKREEEYGEIARTAAIMKATFGVFVESLMFAAGIMGDMFTPTEFLFSLLIFLSLGGLCVPCMFDRWEREILEQVVQESSSIQLPGLRHRQDNYVPIAATEVTAVHHEASEETVIPLVKATPVDRGVGVMEIIPAHAVRIDPPVPDHEIG